VSRILQPFAAVLLVVTVAASAGEVWVGGQPMYTTKDIVDNAVHSADHTTLVAAVQAAGLVETLKGKGPFTVFAPTNDAFENLPAGTLDMLLRPEHKAALTKVLTYHVVAGRLDAATLRQTVRTGKGKAKLETASGGVLWVRDNGDNLIVQDEKGGIANIAIANVMQSNGVIHVVDRVLLSN
jgi:uncharacterized surface protein with fasciclin (FAS1) repeats